MKIRKAKKSEYAEIFLMGFDVWSESQTEDVYVQGCINSAKYKLGEWFVLEKHGRLVSSLIVYKNAFGLEKRFVGLGSIATNNQCRGKGYASILIAEVCNQLKSENCLGIYLHSDIGAEFYKRFGFASLQGKCMVKLLGPEVHLSDIVPSYF